MATCRQCEHFTECSFEAACSHAIFDPDYDAEKCAGYNQIKMTNADRIRALSDEELADFITNCGCYDHARDCKASCKDCTMEWLKQPAEVE